MRVALGLYGDLRQFEITYPVLLDNLNLKDHEYDVFIYTSEKYYIKLQNLETYKWEIKSIKKPNLEKFTNIQFMEKDERYLKKFKEIEENLKKKMKLLTLENLSEKNKRFIQRYRNMYSENYRGFDNNKKAEDSIHKFQDQFLKFYFCCDMIENYAIKNKIHYDRVVLTRADNYLGKKLDLSNFLDKEIYFRPHCDYFFILDQKILSKLKLFVFEGWDIEDGDLILNQWQAPEYQMTKFIENNFNYSNTKFMFRYYNRRIQKGEYWLDKDPFKGHFEKLYGVEFKNISQPCIL